MTGAHFASTVLIVLTKRCVSRSPRDARWEDDADVVKKVENLGLLPHAIAPIHEAQAYIKSEIELWGGLIRKLGLAGSIQANGQVYPLVGSRV